MKINLDFKVSSKNQLNLIIPYAQHILESNMGPFPVLFRMKLQNKCKLKYCFSGVSYSVYNAKLKYDVGIVTKYHCKETPLNNFCAYKLSSCDI